ncbi:MAG: sterol desaturase family protein [Kofleriaceae bacterium]|nr:sterol desaturase family protein [Kofleriaceae bacterium]
MNTNPVPTALIVIVLASVVAEALWSRWRRRGVYSGKETASNAFMMLVSQVLKPLSLAWTLFVLSLLEPVQTFSLPDTGWAFLLTFVVTDFVYYWYHRLSHEMPVLWSMHHTHHSSPWMNLTTAVRLNWVAKFLIPLVFLPLVLLGMSPAHVSLSLALGLLFQFFLHTEAVGKLGWFEGKLFNTPSAHRVHHGSNREYIDKNYAGVFIVWDRLFGTYQAEQAPVRYGVTSGFMGHNPIKAQLYPLLRYLRGRQRTELR